MTPQDEAHIKALEAEIRRLRCVMETCFEMADRPLYNGLEVGFRHHPLSVREQIQRYAETCQFIAHDLRTALKGAQS